VYDFGFDTEYDLHFFTAELIEGRSFFEATRSMDPLGAEVLVVQTLRALEYLHNHHLVHFDIKPGNVLITDAKDGTLAVKVIDFGVADFGSNGRLVGTPSYMAPEMTRRDSGSARRPLFTGGDVVSGAGGASRQSVPRKTARGNLCESSDHDGAAAAQSA
jgi:serine/threonine-protein kinase